MDKNENLESEVSHQKIDDLQKQLDESKKKIIAEMQLRAQRCTEEMTDLLKKHGCSLSNDVQVIANAL